VASKQPKNRPFSRCPPREHAFDIGRCFVAAAKTIPEAKRRFDELGAADAPKPPKLKPGDGLGESDSLATT
jgi:hypothetical protein